MNQRILLSAIDRGSCLWGENIFDDRPCSINANKSENVMSWSTFGEDKSDERYHWSHNDETLIKLLLTGIRIGIWQPFCSYGNLHNRSYSRHSLYLHECVCVFVCAKTCLLVTLWVPSCTDSQYRWLCGMERRWRRARYSTTLWLFEHTHTHIVFISKGKILFNSPWTQEMIWRMKYEQR